MADRRHETPVPEDELDRALWAIDAEPPPAREGLQEEILEEFVARGTPPVLRIAIAVMAAAATILIAVAFLQRSDPRGDELVTPTTDGRSEIADRDSELLDAQSADEALSELERQVWLVSLDLLSKRVHAARTQLTPVQDLAEELPVPDPVELTSLREDEQLGILRLAALEQTVANDTDLESLRRRCQEIAATYRGTAIESRAQVLLSALDTER